MVRISSLLLAAVCSGICCAQGKPSDAPETKLHIAHVAAGLLPAVIVKGEAHPAMFLAARMKALQVPGVSIAVIHNGVLEWAQGFGVVAIGGKPVTPETLFQAGSISKPVAATAVLRLVGQGKLSLDADVNTLLTSWKLPPSATTKGKPVTLRELLTHTGGIAVHGFSGYAAGEPVPTLLQVLNGEKPANSPAIRSEAEPGVQWNYSGGGYTIMQQLTIDQTHEPFDQLIQDTVLAPVGMIHSTYKQPLPTEMKPLAATPYNFDGTPILGGAHTYPELAAAGLWTTPTDLGKYLIEINQSLAGKANHVLTQVVAKEMVTRGMGDWGLGLDIGGTAPNEHFGHGGVNAGFEAEMVIYEQAGDGAIVMTNAQGGGELCEELLRSIAAEYHWPDYQPVVRTAVSIDPALLAQYAGSYRVNPQVTLTVTVGSGSRLELKAPNGPMIEFIPASNTTFFSTTGVPDLEFAKSTDGKVTGLILNRKTGLTAPRQ